MWRRVDLPEPEGPRMHWKIPLRHLQRHASEGGAFAVVLIDVFNHNLHVHAGGGEFIAFAHIK
jgi:hypothetical protein